MSTWLLIDAQYLCHRAFHSTGGLRHDGTSTGVAFGVLRDLELFADMFGATTTVLAFDSRNSLRKEILPSYKSTRATKYASETPEEKEKRSEFYQEIARLKNDLLPRAGYQNIFEVDGYEADDIIAHAAFGVSLSGVDDAVIVSADTDLYQCIRQRVVFYNPSKKRVLDLEAFRTEFGVLPTEWVFVKALAGCSTDDVVGIEGVGEKTAAAYIAGTLKSGKKFETIRAHGRTVADRNLPLVRLPYPDLVLPPYAQDEVTLEKLNVIKQELGIGGRRVVQQDTFEGFDLD